MIKKTRIGKIFSKTGNKIKQKMNIYEAAKEALETKRYIKRKSCVLSNRILPTPIGDLQIIYYDDKNLLQGGGVRLRRILSRKTGKLLIKI